jgi:succinate dehydrogenase/fumarate reductase cytochrome b subunit
MDFAQKPTEPGVVPDPVAVPLQGVEPEQVAKPPRYLVWSHRLSLVVFVVFCIELGMLLAILPWTTVWNQNSFVSAYPGLKAIVQNNFVRGIATGIGLVDIWIGIWEAVHYHDPVA